MHLTSPSCLHPPPPGCVSELPPHLHPVDSSQRFCSLHEAEIVARCNKVAVPYAASRSLLVYTRPIDAILPVSQLAPKLRGSVCPSLPTAAHALSTPVFFLLFFHVSAFFSAPSFSTLERRSARQQTTAYRIGVEGRESCAVICFT